MDLPGLRERLDALAHPERVRAIRDLGRSRQAELFEAAAGFLPIGLEDLVPPDAPPLTEVVHHGRNTLPVLSSFQKRFCRPAPESVELWGYNEHPLRPLIGPGYFVATRAEGGEVVIDYTRLPERGAQGWPAVRPNTRGLGRAVYGGMRDVLRGVSTHVAIGRAEKAGKPLDAWFVICREDGV